MSDVLSAEKVAEYAAWVAEDRHYLPVMDARDVIRSHEQMRGERNAAQADRDEYITIAERESARAEAAARAGGCAADALRPFADFPPITTAQRKRGYISSRIDPAWIDAARDALAAYDLAVSGQTAEKEEA